MRTLSSVILGLEPRIHSVKRTLGVKALRTRCVFGLIVGQRQNGMDPWVRPKDDGAGLNVRREVAESGAEAFPSSVIPVLFTGIHSG